MGRAKDRARAIRDARRFSQRYGFTPPPAWAGMSSYETLLDEILECGLLDVPGDFVEIGAFLGGGSYKLASLLKRAPEKCLFVLDVFDPAFDKTECDSGLRMRDVYDQ
jgi:hypothetical protein